MSQIAWTSKIKSAFLWYYMYTITTFYSVERLGQSSHSAPNGLKASREKTIVLRSTRGSRWYPILGFRSIDDLRGQIKHSQRAAWHDYLRDAVKSTGMSKLVPNWVSTLQNTLKSMSGEKLVVLGNPRSVTLYDLGWPLMTLTHGGANIVNS